MTSLESYLFEKTHDKGVIFRVVMIILIWGVLLATFFGVMEQHKHVEPYSLEEPSREQISRTALRDWKDLLKDPEIHFGDFLEAMPLVLDMNEPELDEASADLEKKEMPDEEKEIAFLVFDSLASEKIEPLPELTALVQREPSARYAQQALGVVLHAQGEDFQAARAYELEGVFAEADAAREIAVSLYESENRFSDLERLALQPPYEKLIDAHLRMKLAAERKDWVGFWRYLLPAQYDLVPYEVILMAFLAGIIWLTITCRLLQLKSLCSSSFLLCLAAFILGIASTWPTVFTYFWLEEVWNFKDTGEIFNDVVFYIFGVGITEESMKLLFFCPLIPILLRRDNQLEILLVAGCTGLGFAAEENISYFNGHSTDAMASRFVTANFFHISATALCGLALCRAVSDPRGHGGVFLKWFGGIILIHGLYDIFLGSIPVLGDTQLPAMACYLYLCYKFFGQAHQLRIRHPQIIALNFIFLTGLALLLSLAMIDLSAFYGIQRGLSMIVVEFAGVCLVCYLFVWEFSKH